MNDENKVSCICGEYFSFKPLQSMRCTLHITYIECPACLHRYFALITNPTIRKRLDKTGVLSKRITKPGLTELQRRKAIKKFQNYRRKNQELMKECEQQNRELIEEVLNDKD